ncbi:MAG: hypothetical protein HFI75_08650 [Lachnospiraceae bacterium]|nr:hypothetical protein [Lachnospiraceae bacterium]
MLKKIYKELKAIRKELQSVEKRLESMPEVKLFRKPYDTQIHAVIKIPGKDEYVFMKPYENQEQTPIIRQDRGQ